MNEGKKKRLEAKGWKVGTVAEFLELTPEEVMLVETQLDFSNEGIRKKLLSYKIINNNSN